MVAMNAQTAEYRPDVIITPGEHVQEMIDERDWTQVELARRMGRPIQTINEIIRGKRAITAETALQLEEVLGLSAQTWMNFESSYRLALARRKRPQRDVHEMVLESFCRNIASASGAEARWIGLGDFVHDLQPRGAVSEMVTDTNAWILSEPEEVTKVIRRLNIDREQIHLFQHVATSMAAFSA